MLHTLQQNLFKYHRIKNNFSWFLSSASELDHLFLHQSDMLVVSCPQMWLFTLLTFHKYGTFRVLE
jgi:hypothetical protein